MGTDSKGRSWLYLALIPLAIAVVQAFPLYYDLYERKTGGATLSEPAPRPQPTPARSGVVGLMPASPSQAPSIQAEAKSGPAPGTPAKSETASAAFDAASSQQPSENAAEPSRIGETASKPATVPKKTASVSGGSRPAPSENGYRATASGTAYPKPGQPLEAVRRAAHVLACRNLAEAIGGTQIVATTTISNGSATQDYVEAKTVAQMSDCRDIREQTNPDGSVTVVVGIPR